MASSVIQLKCNCNNYPWGKKGKESLAAVYASKTPGTDFKIEDGKEYAEMWMGTYPTTPSYVLSSSEDLQDVLNANAEELIGQPVLQKFGKELPFLPKILSIAKALTLQIHPDKDLAALLHRKEPEKFSDANHKPEIAVALSRFEAFVGWKPLPVIQSLFDRLAPLRSRFLPEEHAHFDAETLKQVVRRILTASDSVIETVQREIKDLDRDVFGRDEYICDLLPRLEAQYSQTDPGTLVALFCMNFVVLAPGQAIYVPADSIHAYLSGDIVECMARSDNVLNTGFCPRPDRDSADLFCQALTFAPRSDHEATLSSTQLERGLKGKTRVYAPPLSEFKVILTKLLGGETETVQAIPGPSIMIVTSGAGTMATSDGAKTDISEGFIFFVGCGVDLSFEPSPRGGLEVYRAFCEV